MTDTTHIYQGSIKGSISSSGNISGFLSNKTEVKGSVSGSSYAISANVRIPFEGTGSKDYNVLKNKPSIESHELIGNQTFEELGMIAMSNLEIEQLLNLS